MECPRCSTTLDRYTLDSREAAVCGSCGWVGVPVEHRSEFDKSESWADALERFRTVNRAEKSTDLRHAFVRFADADGEE